MIISFVVIVISSNKIFMSQFYTLPIESIEKTTEDCAVVSFEVGTELVKYFEFTQGQYLTLKAHINGEEVRRSYSLCTSPLDNKWSVAIKKIEAGKFSTFANEVLKKGDSLEVMPPNGRFFIQTDKTTTRNYVAFAAGSGITPILSIIKTHLQAEPNCTFKLFYINQAVSTIILKEEIEALKNQYLNRFEIFHFLTKQHRDIPLFNGRLDRAKLSVIFSKIVDTDFINDYFICGPTEMIFMIRDFLIEKSVETAHIHFELFNTEGIVKKKAARIVDAGKLSDITIIEGGKRMNFKIPQGSNNLLDAAMNHHADLPYACKGGVCCTCRAKLEEGTVEMAVNYALEQEEVDAGFILSCQAVPTSEKVVVNFDV